MQLLFLSVRRVMSLGARDGVCSTFLKRLPVSFVAENIFLVLSLKDHHDVYSQNKWMNKSQNLLTLMGLGEDFGWKVNFKWLSSAFLSRFVYFRWLLLRYSIGFS